MKNPSLLGRLFWLYVFVCPVLSASAQGTQVPITVKVHSGNFYYGAYLHLPDEYADSVSKKYPLLMFFHGAGEAGTNLPAILNNGVPYWINQGSKMQYTNPADGKLYKFICVSIQHPSYSCNANNIYHALIDLKSRYRIDTTRIYLTGLSAGGASTLLYPTLSQSDANKIAAIVPMSPATQSLTFSNLRYLAYARIHSWFITGTQDISYMAQTNRVIDTINSYQTGLTRKTAYNGGHCCWNNFYNPNYRENGMNIYEWMLTHKLMPNQPPVAEAGNDITTPPAPVGLNGAASVDVDGAIVSYNWTKVSGPAQYTLNSTSVATPQLSNVAAGTYQFQLAVTDNRGAVSVDQVTVNVTNAALPVSLRNFRGVSSGNTAFLYWQTESESNSDLFTVERSTDGIQFEPLGSRRAAGNSSTTRYYDFTDPDMPGGISYYRLRQTDKDGSFEFSSTIQLQRKTGKMQIGLLPNPATHTTQLVYTSPEKGRIQIRLYSTEGKLVMEKALEKNQETLSAALTVATLPPGMYTAVVSGESGNIHRTQLVIQ